MKRILIFIAVIFLNISFLYPKEENSEREELMKKIDFIESQKTFWIEGKGIIWSENLKAEGEDIDPSLPVREHNNYMTVDFTIIKKLFPEIKISGTLRFQNDFSGFYLAGDSFSVREIYVESIMLDFIKLRIGDFYQTFTPLTFYVDIKPLGYKNSIFDLCEEKKIYDSYLDKGFPLQGLSGSADFQLHHVFDKLNTYISVARYTKTNYNRIIFSSKLDFVKKQNLNIGLILVDYYDIKQTGTTNIIKPPFNNLVYSINFEMNILNLLTVIKKKETSELKLKLEFANSIFTPDLNNSEKIEDYGLITSISGCLYKNSLELEYIDIGNEFYSPSAQTPLYYIRTINDLKLSYLSSQNLNYHFAQREYNNKIKFYRQWYNPYQLVFPMNKATPNRKGYILNYKNRYLRLISLELAYGNLKEIRGMRTSSLRDFNLIAGGIEVDFSTLYTFMPVVSAGYEKEGVKRDDDTNTEINEAEDIKSEKWSLSCDFPVFKSFDFLIGYIKFIIKGKHWIDFSNKINPLDEDINTTFEEVDLNQSAFMVGGKYNINRNSFILLYYKFLISRNSYKLDFINLYTSIKF